MIISEHRYSDRCKYLMESVVVNIVKLVCRYRWEILYHFNMNSEKLQAEMANNFFITVREAHIRRLKNSKRGFATATPKQNVMPHEIA